MNIQIASSSTKKLIPRHDQIRLRDGLLHILSSADHAYLESPTATGKTLTIALTGERLPRGLKLFLVHRIDILEQTRKAFRRFAVAGLIRDLKSWRFLTWQAYCNAVKSGPDALKRLLNSEDVPVAFVDECHMGGSIRQRSEKNTSFALIRSSAAKVVWVSATPWDVDEDIMGAKQGHTALLTITEAYQLNLLNPAEIIRIDCGLDLRTSVAQLEVSEGQPLSRLINSVFEADSSDAEDSYEQLSAQLNEALGRDLRASDVALIVRHRSRLLCDLYLDQHRGEKAIIWVANQTIARECTAYLTARLDSRDRARAFISDTNKTDFERLEDENARLEFVDPNSNLKVACVVYRLREGFDKPDLYIGLDAAWNPRSLRNTTQKLGRLIRQDKDKPASRYYYAVDVKTVAGARGRSVNPDLEAAIALSANQNVLSTRTIIEALTEVAALSSQMSGAPELTSSSYDLYDLLLNGKSYRATRIPLFEIDHAEGYREIERYTLDRLYAETAVDDSAIRDLLDKIIEAGSLPQKGKRELRWIWDWIDVEKPTYKPWVRLALLDIIVKHEDIRAQSVDVWLRLERAVIAIEMGGKRPSVYEPGGKDLAKALSSDKSRWRPDLKARLKRLQRDDIFVRTRTALKNTTAQNIERVVGSIEGGADRPNAGTPDRRRLDGWLLKGGKKYSQNVWDRIAKCRPEYLPKSISYAERDALTRSEMQRLLSEIRLSKLMPKSGTRDYSLVRSWIKPSSGAYKPEFVEALNAIVVSRPINLLNLEPTQEEIDAIMRPLEKGFSPPDAGTPEYKKLRAWLGLSNQGILRNEEVLRRIAKARPELLSLGRAAMSAKTKILMDEVLADLKDFGRLPKPDTRERVCLTGWLRTDSHTFKPDFHKIILENYPYVFDELKPVHLKSKRKN